MVELRPALYAAKSIKVLRVLNSNPNKHPAERSLEASTNTDTDDRKAVRGDDMNHLCLRAAPPLTPSLTLDTKMEANHTFTSRLKGEDGVFAFYVVFCVSSEDLVFMLLPEPNKGLTPNGCILFHIKKPCWRQLSLCGCIDHGRDRHPSPNLETSTYLRLFKYRLSGCYCTASPVTLALWQYTISYLVPLNQVRWSMLIG